MGKDGVLFVWRFHYFLLWVSWGFLAFFLFLALNITTYCIFPGVFSLSSDRIMPLLL